MILPKLKLENPENTLPHVWETSSDEHRVHAAALCPSDPHTALHLCTVQSFTEHKTFRGT